MHVAINKLSDRDTALCCAASDVLAEQFPLFSINAALAVVGASGLDSTGIHFV